VSVASAAFDLDFAPPPGARRCGPALEPGAALDACASTTSAAGAGGGVAVAVGVGLGGGGPPVGVRVGVGVWMVGVFVGV
jgi:hypothetical protein